MKPSQEKKHQQLGMNPGTASNRLVKDLLFDFVQKAGINCFQCGGPLTRDDFSIEHKVPWLDSADPVKLFFDLDNISYSHQVCNYTAVRMPYKLPDTPQRVRDRHRVRCYRQRRRRALQAKARVHSTVTVS